MSFFVFIKWFPYSFFVILSLYIKIYKKMFLAGMEPVMWRFSFELVGLWTGAGKSRWSSARISGAADATTQKRPPARGSYTELRSSDTARFTGKINSFKSLYSIIERLFKALIFWDYFLNNHFSWFFFNFRLSFIISN